MCSSVISGQDTFWSYSIWRRHVDQLRAVSPSISSNCDDNEALTDMPILGGNQSNTVDLIPDSEPLTQSTFADRYPVRQCRAPDRYGISSPSE